MAIEKILIVDDEMLVRNFLAETLRRKNLDVSVAENGQKAINLLKSNHYDLVITDMKLPDFTGIDILKKAKEQDSATIVIVITAFGTVENAVEAMHLGAFNYLLKPFSPDTIEAIIDKAKEHQSLVHENQYLRREVSKNGNAAESLIIAVSPTMKKILNDVKQVAQSNASVFINGESGTGKEVIAQAIHHFSPRANKPFIKVNCAAIPESLVEAEFFGHEKGAFTGANNKRLGRFELANGGTLLLDEVTEIPIGLQAKLLRAIQEQEFERVGGSKPVKVDVRLIATSNRNMKEAIAQKVLREDLYYRLNVVPIHLSPLRERKEDIIPLVEYFLEKMSHENHQEKKQLSKEAENKLLAYSWPGNVRELANIIERAVVMDRSQIISGEHIFLETVQQDHENIQNFNGMTLADLEKKLIVETLHANAYNRTKTAEMLGITLKMLRSKIENYNLAMDE